MCLPAPRLPASLCLLGEQLTLPASCDPRILLLFWTSSTTDLQIWQVHKHRHFEQGEIFSLFFYPEEHKFFQTNNKNSPKYVIIDSFVWSRVQNSKNATFSFFIDQLINCNKAGEEKACKERSTDENILWFLKVFSKFLNWNHQRITLKKNIAAFILKAQVPIVWDEYYN